MGSPREIWVTTASFFEGCKVLSHVNPISAHIVAGTNLFSDFFASFSDFFGGRSGTYRNQLRSLYNDAIEELKVAAFEIGANAIVGHHVDMDEISGKGKSMFMVTATGSAVFIDKSQLSVIAFSSERIGAVSSERVYELKQKRDLIKRASQNSLELDDTVWEFITINQIDELSGFLIRSFDDVLLNTQEESGSVKRFYERLLEYFRCHPLPERNTILYEQMSSISEGQLLDKMFDLLKDLKALDFEGIEKIFQSDDFQVRKRALRILSFDKYSYTESDLSVFSSFSERIKTMFPELHTRTFKKQLLSSKEKEVWICGCKSSVEIGKICGHCKIDIFGFTAREVSPNEAVEIIDEKIDLIRCCLISQ